MEILELASTGNTPSVTLNHQLHLLEFAGDSRPEDVQKFYTPIISWIEDYSNYVYFLTDSQNEEINITCNFKFEYFNSSSAKYVMDIIVKLGKIAEFDKANITLNWYFDELDEDMKESGEEFEDMLDISFNYISVK